MRFGAVAFTKKIGKYEILSELRSDARCIVCRGRDPFTFHPVEISTLSKDSAKNADLLALFMRQGQAAAEMRHPNIIAVYGLGLHGGAPYIAYELLEGSDLGQIIFGQEGGNNLLPLSIKLNYIMQVCRALDYAHKRGILHRDIKPGNIFITTEGTVKLLHFGLPWQGDKGKTHTGMVVGTLAYMSPQHILGETADARSDIWAVGIMSYEILPGRRPFLGENLAELMMSITMGPTPSLLEAASGIPPSVVAVVEKLLRREVEERYQTVAELLINLGAVHHNIEKES